MSRLARGAATGAGGSGWARRTSDRAAGAAAVGAGAALPAAGGATPIMVRFSAARAADAAAAALSGAAASGRGAAEAAAGRGAAAVGAGRATAVRAAAELAAVDCAALGFAGAAAALGATDRAGVGAEGAGERAAAADAAGRVLCVGPPASAEPSTMIGAPQRLHVILTFRPRTFSSGTAYLAGQLPQFTFIVKRAFGDACRSLLGASALVPNRDCARWDGEWPKLPASHRRLRGAFWPPERLQVPVITG